MRTDSPATPPARAGSPCHVGAVLSLVLFAVTALPSPSHAADVPEPAPAWRAGVATVKITPPEPVWMAGYAGRTKPATGTLNDLWAKALVLQDAGGKRVLLVTLDVCGIDRGTSDHVRDRVKERLGIDRDAVALCASHTHSGPATGYNLRLAYAMGEPEFAKVQAYTKWMEDAVVEAAARAAADLRPVDVRYGVGSAAFAVNRRANKEADVNKLAAAAATAAGDGAAGGGPAAAAADWRKQLKGPVDHDLPVLAVSAGGKPLALVFGYACHATTLDGYDWSGDWPGFAAEAVQAAHPGATALFVAGCGADQNPLPRRKIELAKGYGQQIADGVSAVLRGEMRPVAGPLATRYAEIDLPFGQLPTREQLEQQKASADPKDRYLARRAGMLLERLEREGKLQETYPYPVQTWRLGPAGPTLVLLGGEVVVDYSLRFKRELGGSGNVWPIGYANDVMAYVPSKRVLDEGGYEGGGAMVYYGLPASWGAEVEERIVGEVRRQVKGK